MTLVTKRSVYRYVWRNIVAGLGVLLLWYIGFSGTKGYWAVEQMLPDNMAVISEYPNASLDDRWEMKLGGSYQYLKFLKDNTPPSAVILYPSREAFFPTGVQSQFQGEPYNKIWATRFLYPRRLVLRDEFQTSLWGAKVTHVAIANKQGYDLFDAASRPDSSEMVDFTVLPVK